MDAAIRSVKPLLCCRYGHEADVAATINSRPTPEEIQAAPDALGVVLAVEESRRYQRPTRVAVRSASIGYQCWQSITYVHLVTDRRAGAEAGRSKWTVEALS